ncbi:MAG: alanine racemase [bacterium]|nr:alanine racemase [bacterium]
MPSPRPTRAEVDLDALRHNLDEVKKLVGPEREILAVIKADAYGHGAVAIGCALERWGIRFFGVATVEEGQELRRSGLQGSITVLGGVFPEQFALLLEYGLTPTLYRMEWAEKLSAMTQEAGKKVPVHVKVDTGMGRLGIGCRDAANTIERICHLPGLELAAVFSHFAFAGLENRSFVQEQLACLLEVREELTKRQIPVPLWHLSNSGAVIDFPASLFNMVRPGIMLYGYAPSAELAGKINLKPILSWRTRIVHLKKVPAETPLSYNHTYLTSRESLIATLPVGYADGYPRRLSNRAEALVRGRRAPLVGRVTMDMVLIDVTDIDEATVGDPVTLLGQEGDDRITADELARWADTISYEVLCGISRRVPRIYGGSEPLDLPV